MARTTAYLPIKQTVFSERGLDDDRSARTMMTGDFDQILSQEEKKLLMDYSPEVKTAEGNDSFSSLIGDVIVIDDNFTFRKTDSINTQIEQLTLPQLVKPIEVKAESNDPVEAKKPELMDLKNKCNLTKSRLKRTRKNLTKQSFIINILKPKKGNSVVGGKFSEAETLAALFYAVIFFNKCKVPYSLISQYMGGYRSRTSIRRKLEKMVAQQTGIHRFGLVTGSGRDQEISQTMTQTLHHILSEKLAKNSISNDKNLATFSAKLAQYRASCAEYIESCNETMNITRVKV